MFEQCTLLHADLLKSNKIPLEWIQKIIIMSTIRIVIQKKRLEFERKVDLIIPIRAIIRVPPLLTLNT